MPFRASFDCLWCGTNHMTRTPDDVEGWASLCPECLGKAQDNGFLKMRLRTALADRARAHESADGVGTAPVRSPAGVAASAPSGGPPPPPTGPAPDHDDFYLRRGRFSRGPLHDGPWSMELDDVTGWLDGLGMAGTIVELDAGSGWWSALLAEKGELWIYDADDAALELARKRLVAHGLMAHLHQRDALATPERQVDELVGAYLLGRHESTQRLVQQLSIVHGWLKPEARYAFVEAAARDGDGARIDGPGSSIRTFSGDEVEAALVAAGFTAIEVRTTASAFLTGTARRN
jgi:hypothetical protein